MEKIKSLFAFLGTIILLMGLVACQNEVGYDNSGGNDYPDSKNFSLTFYVESGLEGTFDSAEPVDFNGLYYITFTNGNEWEFGIYGKITVSGENLSVFPTGTSKIRVPYYKGTYKKDSDGNIIFTKTHNKASINGWKKSNVNNWKKGLLSGQTKLSINFELDELNYLASGVGDEDADENNDEQDKPITVVDTTPPAEVTNVTAVVEDGNIYITWKNPSDNDFYSTQITFSPSVQGIEQPVEITGTPSGISTKEFSGFEIDKEYTFILVSVDKNKNKSSGVSIKATLQNSAEKIDLEQQIKDMTQSGKLEIVGVCDAYSIRRGLEYLQENKPEIKIDLDLSKVSGLTYIQGFTAFSNLENVSSVELPDSVLYIGPEAFNGCSGLTKITIPDSVVSIAEGAFAGCSSLEEITIPFIGINPKGLSGYSSTPFCAIFGTKEYEGAVSVTQSYSGFVSNGVYRNVFAKVYYMPATLKKVTFTGETLNPYAFSGCSNLTEIVLTEKIKSIGSNTFDGCSGLTELTIYNGVTEIGENAFNNCSGLIKLTFPDNISEIVDGLCSGCSSLKSIVIKDGITKIGNKAFSGCSSLTKIIIPDSVTSIGDYAFSGCSDLTDITISKKLVTIGNYAFNNCSSFTDFPIPDGLESIGNYAFSGCTSITAITFPNSLTKIGNGLLSGCKNLSMLTFGQYAAETGTGGWFSNNYDDSSAEMNNVTSIVLLDGITKIKGWAYSRYKNLKSITIPVSVTQIESYAFDSADLIVNYLGTAGQFYSMIDYDDEGSTIKGIYIGGKEITEITEIEIPDGITNLRDEVFSNCSHLTSVKIPESVTSIGEYAFSGCVGIKNISIPESVTTIGTRAFEYAGLERLKLPESVTDIGEYAFHGCKSLKELVLPKSISSIKESTFADCTSLEELIMPDSITSIGYYAFSGCTSLGKIYIPDSVESFGYKTFDGCSQNITIGGENAIRNFRNLFPYYYQIESITIMDGVKSIGDMAFRDCSRLKEVNIPESVTEIGKYAFEDCASLPSIIIPETVEIVGDYAFQNCSNLKSVYYDGTLEQWCSKKWSMSIHIAYESYSFYSNDNYDLYIDGQKVTEVVIPDSVTDICAKAFEWCQSITCVTIPASVKTIGEKAFSNCPNLEKVTIKNGLKAIGDYAFYSSSGFKDLTIPESVVRIGFNALYIYKGLENIVFSDTSTKWYITKNEDYTEGDLFGAMSDDSEENAEQLTEKSRANYWYSEKYVVE